MFPFQLRTSFINVSIIGLISGLKCYFFQRFVNLFFSLDILRFSFVVKFLDKILAIFSNRDFVHSHQSLVEEYLLFWFVSGENKSFLDKRKLGSHERESLKYHKYFLILVFGKNLSIEIALQLPKILAFSLRLTSINLAHCSKSIC